VRRVFHLTAVIADRDVAVRPLVDWFGAAVVYQAEDEMFGTPMRRAMLWFGDCLVEMLEPAAGTALHGLLERFGGGLNGVGLEVDDARAAEQRFAEQGVDVGTRYGEFMFAAKPSQTGGVAVQISSRPAASDPRDGAAIPESGGALRPRHLAYVAALVDEPETRSRQLGKLFGTPASRTREGYGPAATVGLGDCLLALWARDDAASSPWGDRTPRPPVVGVALCVDGVQDAVEAAVAAGAPSPTLHGPLAVFDTALPFAVALCADLLPGDPRRGR
jgi:hypothetical protein